MPRPFPFVRGSLVVTSSLTALALIAAACGGADEPAPLDQPEPTPLQSEQQAADADPDTPAVETPEQERASAAQAAQTQAADGDDRPSSQAAPIESDTPSGEGSEYTVQAGDTLGDIAFRHGTTVDAIVAANNITDANALAIGQVLIIPSAEPDEEVEDAAEEETVSEGSEGEDEQAADAEDEAADEQAAAAGEEAAEPEPEPEPEAAPPAGAAGTNPSTIPQPGPDEVSETLASQPEEFGAYGAAALPWLQTKDGVEAIVPLFSDWAMPPVAGGDRLNLVDTDLNGLFSVVMVFTNPRDFGNFQVGSNLVIYDPVPGRDDRYQIAYDHQLASGDEPQDISVLSVVDLTGDGLRDITFQQVFCGAHTCTTSFHVLVRSGDGYRDAVSAPIDIPTAHSLAIDDSTGDGVPDIRVTGGTFGSVGAEPQREYRWLYAAVDGNIVLIREDPQPTSWLVWSLVDANDAFEAGDFVTAIAFYEPVISDPDLTEFQDGELAILGPLARLRQAFAWSQLGDSTAALAAAQAAAAGEGLIADLANAFVSGFLSNSDLVEGCAAFNDGLALRVGEWDTFWGGYGYAVDPFPAEQICPF